MKIGTFDLIAPAITGKEFNEAEILGIAVWLWLHSSTHKTVPLQGLNALLLPAIKRKQFVILIENNQPVCFLSWANLSEAAEARYLTHPPIEMPAQDWSSGHRLWILDWIAPFGHSHVLKTIVTKRLFPGQCFRALGHHGNHRGMYIKQFKGFAVSSLEAKVWFAENPICNVVHQVTASEGRIHE